MTPEQLAELEIWLAAGFDLPTALAAAERAAPRGEQNSADAPASDDGRSPPSAAADRPQPTFWQYLLAFALLGALALVCAGIM